MPFLIPFIAAALVEIGIGAVTAGIIASAIVSIGLSLIATFILAPSVPKPADGKIPKRQSIPPRVRAMGRCRLGGAYMLYEVAPQGRSFDVLALNDGLIDGYERYFLHEDEVTLDGSGYVNALASGAYGDQKVRIRTRLGAATETAYAEAIAMLPTIWTTFHRGDGIASLELICRSVSSSIFQKIYPQGLPQPSTVARWRLLFDPRATGQDPGDSTTWAWSDNPVLMVLTYLITDMGEDYTTRIAPEISYWIAAADHCDELVALKAGGTQKRYTAGGFYQADNDPADVLANMLGTFDGWLGETGSGGLRIHAGVYYEPTVTIDPKHVTSFRVQKYTEDENAINEIIFTYVDPNQKYTEVEGQPWRDETDISERGKVRSQTVSLSWVQSHAQGRRLSKREMFRFSSPARGTVKTDLYGFLALGERYINLNIPELPSLCTFPVQISNTKIDLTTGTLTFDWIMVSAAIDDWDPATEEGTAPTIGGAADAETIPAITGLTVVPVNTASGSTLSVTFDTPTARDDLDFSVIYRLTSGPGPWIDLKFTNADQSGSTVTVTIPGVLPNTSYQVEVAGVAPAGTIGAYTSPVTVSTAATAVPSVPTGLVALPGITQNNISWNANPPTDSVTGYKLYRAAGTGASFGSASLIATLGNVLSYADTGRTSGAGYTYFLKATNAIGDSSPTAGVDCTTQTTPSPTSFPLRIIGDTKGQAPAASEEFFNALMAAGDEFEDASGGAFSMAFLECEVAPAADWTCTLKKNGTTVATGTILASATTGAWSGLAGPLTFSNADNLTLTAQSTADTSIKGVSYGLFGIRTV